MLDIIEQAIARENAYSLFSSLFLNGLSGDLLPYVAQVEALTAVAPQPFNPDEAAADHQQLFGLNIFPYASIFLDSSGLLGGSVTDSVVAQYQNSGFVPPADADHIGCELAFLAFLCGAEADARRDGVTAVTTQIAQLQQNFLSEHLLHWLSPFIIAVQQAEMPFYTELAALTITLIDDHLSSLHNDNLEAQVETTAVATPNIPNLQNESTSLRDIAHFLTTPPACGLYLSRDRIRTLSRDQQLPQGFGNRQQSLLNLLRSAAQYEQLPQLMAGLATAVATWQTAYNEMVAAFPQLEQWQRPWQTRTAQTSQLMQKMSVSVNALESEISNSA